MFIAVLSELVPLSSWFLLEEMSAKLRFVNVVFHIFTTLIAHDRLLLVMNLFYHAIVKK